MGPKSVWSRFKIFILHRFQEIMNQSLVYKRLTNYVKSGKQTSRNLKATSNLLCPHCVVCTLYNGIRYLWYVLGIGSNNLGTCQYVIISMVISHLQSAEKYLIFLLVLNLNIFGMGSFSPFVEFRIWAKNTVEKLRNL